MIPVLVSQRVTCDGGERRDALDRRWPEFLNRCGLCAIPLPNHAPTARELCEHYSGAGLLLTGGNSLAALGGDAPERDALERELFGRALEEGRAVLGVCRGMQLLLDHFGAELEAVDGHVDPTQEIEIEGLPTRVNSFHRFGCRVAPEPLEVWARAKDQVVKGIRHRELPIAGIMWHPERIEPFRNEDLQLFQSFLRPAELT